MLFHVVIYVKIVIYMEANIFKEGFSSVLRNRSTMNSIMRPIAAVLCVTFDEKVIITPVRLSFKDSKKVRIVRRSSLSAVQ